MTIDQIKTMAEEMITSGTDEDAVVARFALTLAILAPFLDDLADAGDIESVQAISRVWSKARERIAATEAP